jgi:hypothetical protein
MKLTVDLGDLYDCYGQTISDLIKEEVMAEIRRAVAREIKNNEEIKEVVKQATTTAARAMADRLK